jgi:hypothetical protein
MKLGIRKFITNDLILFKNAISPKLVFLNLPEYWFLVFGAGIKKPP